MINERPWRIVECRDVGTEWYGWRWVVIAICSSGQREADRVGTNEMERIVFDSVICKLMNKINFRDKHDNPRRGEDESTNQ